MRQPVAMSAQRPHALQPARIQLRAYAPRRVSWLSVARSWMRSCRHFTRSACYNRTVSSVFCFETINPTTFAFVGAIRRDDSVNYGRSDVNEYEHRNEAVRESWISRRFREALRGASHQTCPGAVRSARRDPFAGGRSSNVVWRSHVADHATAGLAGAHCKVRNRATADWTVRRLTTNHNEVLA